MVPGSTIGTGTCASPPIGATVYAYDQAGPTLSVTGGGANTTTCSNVVDAATSLHRSAGERVSAAAGISGTAVHKLGGIVASIAKAVWDAVNPSIGAARLLRDALQLIRARAGANR